MAHAAKFQLNQDKMAQTCWGCGLFASCEPMKYLNEKTLMLCGNCQDYCERYAPVLIKNDIDHLKLRDMLKWWRENHKKLKAEGIIK